MKRKITAGILERLDSAINRACSRGHRRYDLAVALSTEDRSQFGEIFTDDEYCCMLYYTGVLIWPGSSIVRSATSEGSLLMLRNEMPSVTEYRILKDIAI